MVYTKCCLFFVDWCDKSQNKTWIGRFCPHYQHCWYLGALETKDKVRCVETPMYIFLHTCTGVHNQWLAGMQPIVGCLLQLCFLIQLSVLRKQLHRPLRLSTCNTRYIKSWQWMEQSGYLSFLPSDCGVCVVVMLPVTSVYLSSVVGRGLVPLHYGIRPPPPSSLNLRTLPIFIYMCDLCPKFTRYQCLSRSLRARLHQASESVWVNAAMTFVTLFSLTTVDSLQNAILKWLHCGQWDCTASVIAVLMQTDSDARCKRTLRLLTWMRLRSRSMVRHCYAHTYHFLFLCTKRIDCRDCPCQDHTPKISLRERNFGWRNLLQNGFYIRKIHK